MSGAKYQVSGFRCQAETKSGLKKSEAASDTSGQVCDSLVHMKEMCSFGAQSIALRGPDFTLQSDALRCLRFAEGRKSHVANQGLAHSSAVERSEENMAY